MNVQPLRPTAPGTDPRPDTTSPMASPGAPAAPWAGRLREIDAEGALVVEPTQGAPMACDWLHGPTAVPQPGDEVLVMPVAGRRPVVLGRVGPCLPAEARPQPHVVLEAAETLTLKCGESSIDMRADGKVMVRGDDVLLRARGTQRIRAGTVSIN
ncbi:MAG: hypothetical protein KIT17_07295 [Rubrivivax sp.]|nr:hypothetical protein [Rubrivivax sp.]